jgi:hypothetical protein
MSIFRQNRKNVLKVIGKLLTARLPFNVSWNGTKFEINLPATFDVAAIVPEEAAVKHWQEPKPEVRAERPQAQ